MQQFKLISTLLAVHISFIMPSCAHFHVPTDFTKDPIQFVALEDTGVILTHSRKGHVAIGEDKNEVALVDFVGKDVGVLENSFSMQWQNIGNTTQVHFTGTGGSLAGGEGNPGVFLIDGELIRVNLLQKRTDGSFYLEANEDFLMIVAESLPNGAPDVESIKASQFPASGAKLPIGHWHSVPFPIPGAGKLNFVELVAATDKNAVINIPEHTGTPLRIPINSVLDQDD